MIRIFQRRWLRFSLRGLLVIIAITAVWLGYVMKSMRDRREAIRAIDDVGGTYAYNILGPKWFQKWVKDEKCLYDPIRISLGPGNHGYKDDRPVTDQDLERMVDHFKAFGRFTILRLTDSKITDDGMRHVGKMHGITTLSLWGTAVTDGGLEFLAELTTLEQLEISSDQTTADGIAKLQKALPNCKISQ